MRRPRHIERWRRSLLLPVLAASLQFSCVAGEGELTPTPDAGSIQDAGPLDSGTEVLSQIIVSHADGTPAAGSLVYALDEEQGSLLGRTDDAGRYEVLVPLSRFLVRHGFDEVEVGEFRTFTTTVSVVPTAGRPETLDLRGVGMEEAWGSTGVQSFFSVEQRLFATRSLSQDRWQVVELDLSSRSERVIYDVNEPSGLLVQLNLQLPSPSLLAIGHEWTFHTGTGQSRYAFFDLERNEIIAETDWAPGYSFQTSFLVEGPVLHMVELGIFIGFSITHSRLLLDERRIIEGTTARFQRRDSKLAAYWPYVYFQDAEQLLGYDVRTATLVAIEQPRLGRNNWGSTWIGSNGFNTAHIHERDFVYSDASGEVFRAVDVWEDDADVWFYRGNMPGDGPFFATASSQDEWKSFYFDPSSSPPILAPLDIEGVTGSRWQVGGLAEHQDGRMYGYIFTDLGPNDFSHDRISVRPDGLDLRYEVFDIDRSCQAIFAGSISDWPDSIRWLLCGSDQAPSNLYDGAVRRTFFGVTARYPKDGRAIEWQAKVLYNRIHGDQSLLTILDPNAPE